MSKEWHNPGMGEKAWDKFHRLMARLNAKYSKKVKPNKSPKDAA